MAKMETESKPETETESETELAERKRKKAGLRRQILKNRDAVLPEEKGLWDKRIFEHLKAYDQKVPCPVYLCYVNYKSEVSTKEFIKWCLYEKKMIFVPKVMDLEMEFYRIFSLDDLKMGYHGIYEPENKPEKAFSIWGGNEGGEERVFSVQTGNKEEEKRKERAFSVRVGKIEEKKKIRMLLPGAVFDRKGNRIGYGGGFYDRWLEKRKQMSGLPIIEKIGLSYTLQLVEEIPAETFDQKVDFLMTEEGIIGE